MTVTTSAVSPSAAVLPVAVAPGGTIVLRGAFTSHQNNLVVTGCQTGTTEGGATDGQRGLFDYAAGGWEVQARDWTAQTCRLVATGAPAPVCSAAGLASPCLPSRLSEIAHQIPPYTVTASQLQSELRGQMNLDVLSAVEAAAVAPPEPPSWLARNSAGVGVGFGALVVAIFAAVLVTRRRRAPESVVRRTAARVRARLTRSDPVYQALVPTVEALGRQADELAKVRDRLRARFIAADRAALTRRRVDLAARGASSKEAAEAAALVDEQVQRVDRWKAESERASARLDRVLEYLRALSAKLDDALEAPREDDRTGVRIEEDAKLLKDLERDVEASLEGAREADRLVVRLGT